MRSTLTIIIVSLLCFHCYAQEVESRPGCTVTLDEAKYGKPRATAKKYKVTVRWRPSATGIEAMAQTPGGDLPVTADWRLVGFGWLPLNYVANLYYRVSYGPNTRYTLDIMIPDLGFESCTWK